MNTKWYQRFLSMARHVSEWSKDESTKVGAVVFTPRHAVLSVGYNGMVRGMDDDNPAYHERPLKYHLFEHAERNAIYNAAEHGIKLSGMLLACTHFPCSDCARAIVQSGITTLVVPKMQESRLMEARWRESWFASADILNAGEVQLVYMED